jgi:nucleotide-binding universal stress UspA family protein
MPDRVAYIPLNTYPEGPTDAAVLAALGWAETLDCGAYVATFAVDIPPLASPLGGFLLNVEGMARAAEDRSLAECERLRAFVQAHARGERPMQFTHHKPALGRSFDLAAVEARYFDLSLLPWVSDAVSCQDMAQAMVFGSGGPVVLTPASPRAGPLDHIAVAWDESRVAARALGDALRLLPEGGTISVLTVEDEKVLSGSGLAETLAASLDLRGYNARAVPLKLAGKGIAEALQEAAIRQGAGLLAMGGFGHSRLRDFVLGGATRGILADLRIATLIAH